MNGYDVITCFDVLEHVLQPLRVLDTLKHALRDHGILIITVPFGKDDNRPMHIVTDRKIANAIRSAGFNYDWNLIKECEISITRSVLVLKKTRRSCIVNRLYFLYDNIPLNLKKFLSKSYKILRRRAAR
jgi:hypothetical protein